MYVTEAEAVTPRVGQGVDLRGPGPGFFTVKSR